MDGIVGLSLLLFLFFSIVGWLIVKMYRAVQRSRVMKGLKNATIFSQYCGGMETFKPGARIKLELLPTELSMIQDDNTSAILSYSKINSVGKVYIRHLENNFDQSGVRLKTTYYIGIRYSSNDDTEKEILFLYNTYLSGDVKFFIKMLQKNVSPKSPTRIEL